MAGPAPVVVGRVDGAERVGRHPGVVGDEEHVPGDLVAGIQQVVPGVGRGPGAQQLGRPGAHGANREPVGLRVQQVHDHLEPERRLDARRDGLQEIVEPAGGRGGAGHAGQCFESQRLALAPVDRLGSLCHAGMSRTVNRPEASGA